MARPRYPRSHGPLPPPLPPETRTIGQLVAETLRLYGNRFWLALTIGLAPAVTDLVSAELSGWGRLAFAALGGAILQTAAYLAASLIVSGARPERGPLAVAFAAGVLIFIPLPFLASLFILPGLMWLALFGLAVPVALIERVGLRAAFARAVLLGRADYIHALGSLATLTIALVLTRFVLYFLLLDFGDSTERTAAFLADVLMYPVLFLGAALLYYDQAARVGRRAPVRPEPESAEAGRL